MVLYVFSSVLNMSSSVKVHNNSFCCVTLCAWFGLSVSSPTQKWTETHAFTANLMSKRVQDKDMGTSKPMDIEVFLL